jgi:hypothetical protein
MRARFIAVTSSGFVLAIAIGCTRQTPVQPTPDLQSAVPATGSAASPYGGHAVPLTEVAGSVPVGGRGTLNDTQTAEPGFNNFELDVSVHGGPPDTDLYFQFVGDVNPATRGDGKCPDPFPNPPGNTIAVMRTSAGGSASTHVKFEVPEGAFLGTFDSGVKSDFKWRVVNLEQTFDLRTSCVVLTGK